MRPTVKLESVSTKFYFHIFPARTEFGKEKSWAKPEIQHRGRIPEGQTQQNYAECSLLTFPKISTPIRGSRVLGRLFRKQKTPKASCGMDHRYFPNCGKYSGPGWAVRFKKFLYYITVICCSRTPTQVSTQDRIQGGDGGGKGCTYRSAKEHIRESLFCHPYIQLSVNQTHLNGRKGKGWLG